jgi:formylglycine-generating enzyme required for sulfatase activity
LSALLEYRGLEAVGERLSVSFDLAKLGDSRPGVGLRPDGMPNLAFDLPLPAGQLTLAENDHTVRIEKPYKLSRYPVTVAQFQAFKAAGGYADDGSTEAAGQLGAWWSEDGLQWKHRNNITGPADYGPVFQTPNHPRAGVSWYEAEAFCRWVSEVLRLEIRLPHEAEWEQAARRNAKAKRADSRTYPWGEGDEKHLVERCNWFRTGIGHTSAVGLFPDGKADSGALDLSGNVWESCENWYDAKQPYRVLRGGSWYYDRPEALSCSFRLVDRPAFRVDLFGFRCVWVVGSVR